MSESSSLIKRDANKFFPVKFPKFWILPCFTEHFQWLLLKVSGFQPANQFRKGLLQRCFSVNFAKFLRTSFVLTEHLRETAFSCTSCKISTTRYGKKLFCTRTRRSHLKAFIFSKSYQPASFQKKKKTLLHILLHVFFFHFLRTYQDSLYRKSFESVWHNFFQEMKAESSLTCNVLVQLRFI